MSESTENTQHTVSPQLMVLVDTAVLTVNSRSIHEPSKGYITQTPLMNFPGWKTGQHVNHSGSVSWTGKLLLAIVPT